MMSQTKTLCIAKKNVESKYMEQTYSSKNICEYVDENRRDKNMNNFQFIKTWFQVTPIHLFVWFSN